MPNPPPPLCVWCNAPWTDDMVKIFARAEMDWGYYLGDGHVESIAVNIDVTCKSCGRLVYRKECLKKCNSYYGDTRDDP